MHHLVRQPLLPQQAQSLLLARDRLDKHSRVELLEFGLGAEFRSYAFDIGAAAVEEVPEVVNVARLTASRVEETSELLADDLVERVAADLRLAGNVRVVIVHPSILSVKEDALARADVDLDRAASRHRSQGAGVGYLEAEAVGVLDKAVRDDADLDRRLAPNPLGGLGERLKGLVPGHGVERRQVNVLGIPVAVEITDAERRAALEGQPALERRSRESQHDPMDGVVLFDRALGNTIVLGRLRDVALGDHQALVAATNSSAVTFSLSRHRAFGSPSGGRIVSSMV